MTLTIIHSSFEMEKHQITPGLCAYTYVIGHLALSAWNRCQRSGFIEMSAEGYVCHSAIVDLNGL